MGLRLHLLEWDGGGPVVILLHGYLEHAHAWDWAAPRIAAAGYRVLAWDARGHGDSDRVGRGGYYHYADYVADLAFVRRSLGEPVALVGHSMGGNIAAQYAGTEPERVWALISIEGLGPADNEFSEAPSRMAQWIENLERAGKRPARTVESVEAGAKLLAKGMYGFSEVAARHVAEHGLRPAGEGEAPGWHWKFDPLHRTRGPQPFYVAQCREFWKRVRCPSLYLEGTRPFIPGMDLVMRERAAELAAECATLEGCGHHPHLEDPESCAAAMVAFLDRHREALPP